MRPHSSVIQSSLSDDSIDCNPLQCQGLVTRGRLSSEMVLPVSALIAVDEHVFCQPLSTLSSQVSIGMAGMSVMH